MGSKLTKLQLREITDYIGFESLCHDLMARQGYRNILPLGGFKDKGRDAIHVNQDSKRITIFAYSVREDWEKKLLEDLVKIKNHNHNCDEVIFVTTSEPTSTQIDFWKDKVQEDFNWILEFYHLERIATLIDSLYSDLKNLHPNIFFYSEPSSSPLPGEPIDLKIFADHMLNAFKEWQERYTPLLADHREFEMYAINTSPIGDQQVQVLRIPEIAPVVVLLGESGAGKTTALWKLVTDYSYRIIKEEPGLIPVMVSLRNWSPDCSVRQLIQDQLSLINATHASVEEELINGNCLILIDGLNELSRFYSVKDQARRDLQNFLVRYQKNRFVFTCRTPDYDPKFLEVRSNNPPDCFEIRRLERDQIEDYVRRYFREDQSSAQDLLLKLDVQNDQAWRQQSSFIRLAQIPLHLQMIILEYKHSEGRIPTNKAKMLDRFVSHMADRDQVRQVARVSIDVKRRLLGRLAYEALRNDYYLSIPVNLAKSVIGNTFEKIRKEQNISSDTLLNDVWIEILSNNFLTQPQPSSGAAWLYSDRVEWLHQSIFDCFLAYEIIRVLVIPATDEGQELKDLLIYSTNVWDQPCQIALGLLDFNLGSKLLEIFVNVNRNLAQKAFSGQNEDDAALLALTTVQRITNTHDIDRDLLERFALTLPYLPTVNSLLETFKVSREDVREIISQIMSLIVREHYGATGAKRAENILEAWIANKNEVVRFYSAIGLWERDRGRAANVLRELYISGSPGMRELVKELMEEWGIS